MDKEKKKKKRLLDDFAKVEPKLPKKNKKKTGGKDKASKKLAKLEKRLEEALDFEWESPVASKEPLLSETIKSEELPVLQPDREYFAELKDEDDKPETGNVPPPEAAPETGAPSEPIAPAQKAQAEKTEPEKAPAGADAKRSAAKKQTKEKSRSKGGLFGIFAFGRKKKAKKPAAKKPAKGKAAKPEAEESAAPQPAEELTNKEPIAAETPATEKPAAAETQHPAQTANHAEPEAEDGTKKRRRKSKKATHVDGQKLQDFWEKKQWTWKMVLTRTLIVLATIGLGIFELIRLCDDSYFVDTFYEVEDEKIISHIRIVLLTDQHLHVFGNDNDILVDEIQRLQPDIIAMAGDMVDMNRTDYSSVLSLCQRLVNIAPVYFSYGNHEKEVIRVQQTSTINVDLEAMGVHVLHNRYETIEVNGNRIDIGGLSANPGTMDADYTQSFWQSYLKTENYRLLLVHYPQFFYPEGELADSDIDMALCGHLHGGQVVIPYFGGLYHPTGGFHPDLASGCTGVGGTWVVVSRGLGNGKSFPRVNNPPELVIVDLY